MKIRIIASLITLAVLASLFAGCSPKQDSYLIEIMKMVPQDATDVWWMNLVAMAKDPDLVDAFYSMQDYIYDEIGWSYEAIGGPIPGLDLSDGCTYAMVDSEIDYLIIVQGEYDLTETLNILKSFRNEYSTYYGAEVLIMNNFALALMEDVIIVGVSDYVLAPIRIINGEEPSLYDNDDVESVVDRLPAGIGGILHWREGILTPPALGYGISLSKPAIDDSTVEIEGWFKFDSESGAEAALADVEGFMDANYIPGQINCQLEGVFVAVTGESDTSIIH